jgi:vacuolar-type H+-ATPase subunit I/STV1
MEKSFSWQNFEKMSRALESLGYLVIVVGPIAGIVLLFAGDAMMKLLGAMVILASILIALYHISFSMLMNAIQDLSKIQKLPEDKA